MRASRLARASSLSAIVEHDALRANPAPGLWQAAAQIATPHLRNMGTIGGNLCLDTRCTYYDQSEEWRKAIGYCMKKDGSTCWVATSSPKCLAVSSTDTAPMLLALDARVRLVSAAGDRTIGLADLYANDGMHYLTPSAGRDPDRDHGAGSDGLAIVVLEAAAAWVVRLSGRVGGGRGAHGRDNRVADARIVLGAVASQPMASPKAGALLVGQTLSDDAIAAAADAAYDVAKPMDNTDFELVWRKKTVRALVTSALRELRGDAPPGPRKFGYFNPANV